MAKNKGLKTQQVMCRHCQKPMRFATTTNGIEIWKCRTFECGYIVEMVNGEIVKDWEKNDVH